jgi:hypothetical protein
MGCVGETERYCADAGAGGGEAASSGCTKSGRVKPRAELIRWLLAASRRAELDGAPGDGCRELEPLEMRLPAALSRRPAGIEGTGGGGETCGTPRCAAPLALDGRECRLRRRMRRACCCGAGSVAECSVGEGASDELGEGAKRNAGEGERKGSSDAACGGLGPREGGAASMMA